MPIIAQRLIKVNIFDEEEVGMRQEGKRLVGSGPALSQSVIKKRKQNKAQRHTRTQTHTDTDTHAHAQKNNSIG